MNGERLEFGIKEKRHKDKTSHILLLVFGVNEIVSAENDLLKNVILDQGR